MQHVKNAIGGNAMKMLKMHQNALKCTRMRMGKNYTTFGKKLHETLRGKVQGWSGSGLPHCATLLAASHAALTAAGCSG